MPSEPTLAELIAKANEVLNELLELIQKIIKAKELRNLQAQRTSDGANEVPGYGTLASANPSDEEIDLWGSEDCDDFANACKSRCEALQAGGGN